MRAAARGGAPRAAPRQADGARAWFIAAVSLVLAGTVTDSRKLAPDSLFDLNLGRYIAAHGLPRRNVWTVAAHGAPWTDQQWLAHLIFYAAWRVAGYPGLAALSAALITGGFAMLALLMLRRGIPPARMFAWTMVAFLVCLGNTTVRAQSFGYLYFGITISLLVTDRPVARMRARTWLVIPVLLLWANSHGSVLLGAGLAALYGGYRSVLALARRDKGGAAGGALLAVASIAAALCTPYGLAIARYYQSLLGRGVLSRYITEWAPPRLESPLSWGFFALVVLCALAFAVAWLRGARPDPILMAGTLILLCLALTAERNQAWFGFGGSLFAADTLARARPAAGSLSRGFRSAVATVLAAAALTSLVALASTPVSTFEAGFPIRALDAAASIAAGNPSLRMIGDDWSDTPMLWLHPAMTGRVGFDIREEQYTSAQLSDYFDFLLRIGPHWQRVTAGYGIIVISRRQYPWLAAAVHSLPGWRLVFSDRGGSVLVRADVRTRTGPPRRGSR